MHSQAQKHLTTFHNLTWDSNILYISLGYFATYSKTKLHFCFDLVIFFSFQASAHNTEIALFSALINHFESTNFVCASTQHRTPLPFFFIALELDLTVTAKKCSLSSLCL